MRSDLNDQKLFFLFEFLQTYARAARTRYLNETLRSLLAAFSLHDIVALQSTLQ